MTIKVSVSKLCFFLIAIILLLRCSHQNVTCPTTLYKTATGVRQFFALSVNIHHQLTWKKKGTQLQRGENTCVNKPLVEKQGLWSQYLYCSLFSGPNWHQSYGRGNRWYICKDSITCLCLCLLIFFSYYNSITINSKYKSNLVLRFVRTCFFVFSLRIRFDYFREI